MFLWDWLFIRNHFQNGVGVENVVIWVTIQHDMSMCIRVYILVSPLTSALECKSWTDFLMMPVTYLHFIGILCHCALLIFAVLTLLYCTVYYFLHNIGVFMSWNTREHWSVHVRTGVITNICMDIGCLWCTSRFVSVQFKSCDMRKWTNIFLDEWALNHQTVNVATCLLMNYSSF